MADDTRERFINPYTDFGFKKLFGTEMNKDLLISFLNALFNNSEREIEDIQYLNGENLGDGYGDRRSVFDVYCTTKDGSRFIVEMQKAEQTYFKDRSVYYATTPIRQQAPKGKWDYHLEDVYTVGILNFEFPNDEYPAESYRHEVKLKDVEDNHIFYDKLTFVYLEMPSTRLRTNWKLCLISGCSFCATSPVCWNAPKPFKTAYSKSFLSRRRLRSTQKQNAGYTRQVRRNTGIIPVRWRRQNAKVKLISKKKKKPFIVCRLWDCLLNKSLKVPTWR